MALVRRKLFYSIRKCLTVANLRPFFPIASRRLAELMTIRRLLIPDLVLRVHHTLISTCSILPSNLSRAFELATIVADERYGLYNEFVPFSEREGGDVNLMKRYLEEIRLASLKSTELGMGIVGIVAE